MIALQSDYRMILPFLANGGHSIDRESGESQPLRLSVLQPIYRLRRGQLLDKQPFSIKWSV